MLGKLVSIEKIETGPFSYTIHKKQLVRIKRLKCKTQNHKSVDDKLGNTILDVGSSKDLVKNMPKAIATKIKIDKWDLMKLHSFCTAKETVSSVNQQPTE